MFDATIVKLVRDTMDGKVALAAVLLDRLDDMLDERRHRLRGMLARLTQQAEQAQAWDTKANGRGWRGRDPEEVAYRRGRYCREAWSEFVSQFRELFWAELSGLQTTGEALARVEVVLETPKHAQRLTQPDDDEDDGENGMGEAMMAQARRPRMGRLD